MAVDDFVQVTVTQSPPSLGVQGYETALLLSYDANFTDRVKRYTSTAEVAADFPDANSAERLAATAFFAQKPRPRFFKIGRGLLKPTMQYKLTALTPTAFPTTTYRVRVVGATFAETVTFTTDASPTDAEFATALVTALNGVAGKNYTASGAASPVTVVANTPGDFFSIEVLNTAHIKIENDHVDPGIVTDLEAIKTEDNDWFTLTLTQASPAMIVAAAPWANSNEKIFNFDTNDTDVINTTVGSGSDPIDAVKTLGLRYVSGWYHPNPSAFATFALNARMLATRPGSSTWAFKQLEGVAPVKLTPTQRANLVAKYGNSYEDLNPTRVTFNGRSSNGSYIDLQRGLLWLTDLIKVDLMNFLIQGNQNEIVGFDFDGRTGLESTMLASMKKGVNRGFVVANEFIVELLPVEELEATDRENRIYPPAEIEFLARSAIQGASVAVKMNI